MTIDETAQFLSSRSNFILSSHEEPDADGLGSEYSLASALLSMKKNVFIVNAEPYAQNYSFLDKRKIIGSLEDSNPGDDFLAEATLVLLDTNDLLFTGEIADKIISKVKEVLIIDHHESKITTQAYLCSIPEASSTSEIVFFIIKAMGCTISEDMAYALFTGIVYDTGSFSYAKTNQNTFEAALDLVKKGVNPAIVHSALYESSAISVLLLRKEVMSSLELFADNRIAVQTMNKAILKKTKAAYQESEGLINIPLQAETVEVSVFLKENEEGVLRCSLRSKGKVNVAQIAQNFGGGGHKTAAGFKSSFSIELLKEKVLKLVLTALENQ
ncbi:bifunctional oligoribonuclease/PAP phosphatase NrnA [Spirochaetota bacterium]